MPLPTSGPLSLQDIQTEFGGSNPIALSEYYAGGGLVPSGTSGIYGPIPSSGVISMNLFYGSQASSPGEDWTYQAGLYITTWGTTVATAVVWDGSKFVVTGYSGKIATSPDGITWTPRTSGTTVQSLFCVTWSGTQFVAGATSGRLYTSPDGITWTERTTPTTRHQRGVIWNGTQFLSVGESNTALTSPDGVTWTLRGSTGGSNNFAVAWSGTIYLTACLKGVSKSTDGITWTYQQVYPSYQPVQLRGAAWSGTKFVIVGDGGLIYASPDGATWTQYSSVDSTRLHSITWTGTQFVAVGDQIGSGGPAKVVTSPDGMTWTLRTSNTTTILYGVGASGSKLIAVGSNGSVITSQ